MASTSVKSYQFAINGMTCVACAARIERVLRRDPRNEQVTVNFPARSAQVRTSQEAPAIQKAIADLGYEASPKLDEAERLRREAALMQASRSELITATAITVPVIVLAMLLPDFRGSVFLQLILTTAVLFGPGRHFYVRAAKQIRHGQMSMDSLISLGTAAAYALSVAMLLKGHRHVYFESASVIITLILLGKFLEERARQSIAQAIRELLKLQPEEAWLLQGPGEALESERRVPAASLTPGALILVKPGDRFAVDGIVRRGVSAVDASMLTGESLPVDVTSASPVAAGTVNLTGPLVVETTGTGAETQLAQIVAMVEAAQGSKAPIQKLADQISGWFVRVRSESLGVQRCWRSGLMPQA